MAQAIFQSRQQQDEHADDVRQRKAALKDNRGSSSGGKLFDKRTTQLAQRPNDTGLPDNLKHGIESLSGMSMDNVKVHYNSYRPAQLNAHAYAQGTDIHVAPGQEKHLPHEAWHVVQQAQGRVKPTMQMKQGVPVNDEKGLEREADVMGGKAALSCSASFGAMPVQLRTTIHNTSQAYDYGIGKVNVGKEMVAWLDPSQMPRGQSASVNTSQNDLMAAIRQAWKISGGAVVKGHLLNDNLGGTALNNNLYPITRAANKDHLMYVENMVKEAVWHAGGVHYKVAVDGVPNISNPTATLRTFVQMWNPQTGVHGPSKAVNIPSDLRQVSAYHQAFIPGSDDDPDTLSNPLKPQGFHEPAKSVWELDQQEVADREYQPMDHSRSYG